MKLTLLALLLSLILVPLSSAFASDFLQQNTLVIEVGSTKDYCLYLQNIGVEDQLQAVRVLDGVGHVQNPEVINQDYLVPALTGGSAMPVCMTLALPGGHSEGEKHTITFGVATSTDVNATAGLQDVELSQSFFISDRYEEQGGNNNNNNGGRSSSGGNSGKSSGGAPPTNPPQTPPTSEPVPEPNSEPEQLNSDVVEDDPSSTDEKSGGVLLFFLIILGGMVVLGVTGFFVYRIFFKEDEEWRE